MKKIFLMAVLTMNCATVSSSSLLVEDQYPALESKSYMDARPDFRAFDQEAENGCRILKQTGGRWRPCAPVKLADIHAKKLMRDLARKDPTKYKISSGILWEKR